jgi:acyl carrier protein
VTGRIDGRLSFKLSSAASNVVHGNGSIVNGGFKEQIMPDPHSYSPKDRVLGLVRDILDRHSTRSSVMVDDDLREAGLASIDMVNLMLAVEAEFNLTIPDAAMTIENFRSVSAIDTLVAGLLHNA